MIWRRPHREGEGRLLLSKAFISQEAALAFAARPVQVIGLIGRKARSRALRRLRVWHPDQGRAFFSQSGFG